MPPERKLSNRKDDDRTAVLVHDAPPEVHGRVALIHLAVDRGQAKTTERFIEKPLYRRAPDASALPLWVHDETDLADPVLPRDIRQPPHRHQFTAPPARIDH